MEPARTTKKKQVKAKSKSTSRSARAGLYFPIGRTQTRMRSKKWIPRIGSSAAVAHAAVLQYIMSEMLEVSVNQCIAHKSKRIKPRHILLAIENDAEIRSMLGKIIIPSGGVIPKVINPLLLPKGSKAHEAATAAIVKQEAAHKAKA